VPIRTGVLGTFFGTAAFQIFATVPAGVTWIVKEVCVRNENGGAAACDFYATDSGGTARVMLVTESVPGTSGIARARYLVLGPGSLLWAASSGGLSVYVWVSGSKLPGVAP
jgi:hypothetical protein